MHANIILNIQLCHSDTKPLAGTKINNRKESILIGRQEKREERVSLSRMAR
jgi:hypothetical protein